MTREMEFKKARKRYDDRMHKIEAEYRYKFDNMQPNEAGEYSADTVHELNAWFEQAKKEVLDEFTKTWAKLSTMQK